jgi:tetratricopeptide (TPR) repeat protein/signal recognition particle receptor subunit beta
MAVIEFSRREVRFKIVYAGPEGSGKRTSVRYVFDRMAPERRGKLVEVGGGELIADFLMPFTIGDYKVHTSLYAASNTQGDPNDGGRASARALFIRGADGVVFVADSDIARQEANAKSLHTLIADFERLGRPLDELPLVIQYNKRDRERIATLEAMQATLNPLRGPSTESIAPTGQGVFAALQLLRNAGCFVLPKEPANAKRATQVPAGSVRVECRLAGPTAANLWVVSERADPITSGGVFVPATELLPIGTTVDVKVNFPGDYVAEGQGEIAWHEEGSANVARGYGVRIRNVAEQGAQLFRRYVRSREPLVHPTDSAVIGDFQVERELGRGGMGVVQLVRQLSTGERFAMKMLGPAAHSHADVDAFLRELRAWIDLPIHPNVIACRFFRSTPQGIAIFADVADGGSLASLIATRSAGVGRMLDIAIQVAWGLAAAHSSELIHRDVKPANVLLMQSGEAKLTDFGIALWSNDATSSGMTPAYCSPEQAAHKALGPTTDIWSFGVTMLEMFVGEVTWADGRAASYALDAYLEDQGEGLLPIAPTVVDVLRRCLVEAPTARIQTMTEVADALQAAYATIVGRTYEREPPRLNVSRPAPEQRARRGKGGYAWSDPRVWMERACACVGEPVPVDAPAPIARDQRAQAVSDLARYETVARVLERAGSAHVEQVATFFVDKALVHRIAEDVPGALRCADFAIARLRSLATHSARETLGRVLVMKGNIVRERDLEAAAALYVEAVTLLEAQVFVPRKSFTHAIVVVQGAEVLAGAWVNLATVLAEQRFDDQAAEALARGGVVLERANVDVLEPQFKAKLHLNRAALFASLGKFDEARLEHERAISALEAIHDDDVSQEELAQAYAAMGATLVMKGNEKDASASCAKAIAILDALVKGGRRDLAGVLATTLSTWAVAIRSVDAVQSASALLRAIEMLTTLVLREGRQDLAGDLASALVNQAARQLASRELTAALESSDRAITLRRNLLVEAQRRRAREVIGHAQKLAKALLNRAYALELDRKAEVATAFRPEDWSEYVASAPTSDLRETAGHVASRVGCALLDAGDVRSALELFERAFAFRSALERTPARELDLAIAHANLAQALRVDHRPTEAVQHIDDAIAIAAALERTRQHREKLGAFHVERGAVLRTIDVREAGTSFIAALELFDDLAIETNEANAITAAARTASRAGNELFDQNAKLAGVFFDYAADAYYKLFTTHHDETIVGELAGAIHSAGVARRMNGQPDVVAMFDRARVLEPYGATDSDLASRLAQCSHGAAGAQLDEGVAAPALERLEHALALLASPDARPALYWWIRADRARALSMLGRSDMARAEASAVLAALAALAQRDDGAGSVLEIVQPRLRNLP